MSALYFIDGKVEFLETVALYVAQSTTPLPDVLADIEIWCEKLMTSRQIAASLIGTPPCQHTVFKMILQTVLMRKADAIYAHSSWVPCTYDPGHRETGFISLAYVKRHHSWLWDKYRWWVPPSMPGRPTGLAKRTEDDSMDTNLELL